VGYNNTTASSANVRFDFEGALAAARDLHALAESIRAAQVERLRAADTARAGWVGPKRLELDAKIKPRPTAAAGSPIRSPSSRAGSQLAGRRNGATRTGSIRLAGRTTKNRTSTTASSTSSSTPTSSVTASPPSSATAPTTHHHPTTLQCPCPHGSSQPAGRCIPSSSIGPEQHHPATHRARDGRVPAPAIQMTSHHSEFAAR
jgi:hypothetical protein